MSWLSGAIHRGDAATVSAIAAWAAAIVALVGASFQFFIGRKQAKAALLSAQAALMTAKNAGRYKVAEFRQAWINKVIDTLCELTAIMVGKAGDTLSPQEHQSVISLSTRLEILLNPEEEDTVALLKELYATIESKTHSVLQKHADTAVAIARRLLKREWDRIKDELSHLPTE